MGRPAAPPHLDSGLSSCTEGTKAQAQGPESGPLATLTSSPEWRSESLPPPTGRAHLKGPGAESWLHILHPWTSWAPPLGRIIPTGLWV